MKIVGILNLTRDSFSDGGAYLDCDAAREHAMRMIADGADMIDVGAESTHPDSENVSAETEIER
ncbi:MAG: dihydropteroate synthase, partial [Planctomycetes bacterium]|nr:dihydropteroate synthase [Planctomycetota bacterium]